MDPEDDVLEHAPNLQSEDSGGLYCFLDKDRPCNPACMSYQLPSASPVPGLTQQQTQCTLLVSVERLGRHTGGVVALFKRAQDDRKREQAAVPPRPSPPIGAF